METTTTSIRIFHEPFKEIIDSASTTKKRTNQAPVELAGQQSGSVKPLQHNDNTHLHSHVHSSQRSHPQNNPPPPTSDSRYSKPYSLSKFTPKSHLPHRKPDPSDTNPPQRKFPQTQPIVPQYGTRHLSQTSARSTRSALPNPKAAAPDSDIAEIWNEVQARVETMTDPTGGSQPYMAAGTEVSDGDSQIERTLTGFNTEADLEVKPQLSVLVSPDAAPSISAMLAVEIRSGEKALSYRGAFKYAFFGPPGMPAATIRDASDRIAVPTNEEIVLTSRYLSDDTIKAAGMVFLLAADQTWNDKFQREYLSLLQKADLLLPDWMCSDFLAVLISSEESQEKMESLRNTWANRGKKSLTKQLSVCRADRNEDKWDILTNSRYYGYLLSGMNLEIHEMRYNLPDPPPKLYPHLKAQSEDRAKFESKEDPANVNTANTITATSNIPKPTSKTNPQSRVKSAAKKSKPSAVPGRKQDIPLPLTQLIVKRFDLHQAAAITRFSKFNQALMRWAQAKYCAQYVRNLHALCWQQKVGEGHPWFMTNAEMVSYWAAAAPREERALSVPTQSEEHPAITSPERVATADMQAWGEEASGSGMA